MNFRDLGKTGARVSEVGMGCNRLAEPSQAEGYWIGLVQRAVELGVNIFDTAESYKDGGSERILGKALGNRDDVLVATKMGGPGRDFSASRVVECAEASLNRLQRDRIDIFHMHSPNRQKMETYDWTQGMSKLLGEGKVRLRAVSANNAADSIWLIEQGLVDVLQITYNIFDTQAEETLLALAEQRGIGLLCRLPLAQGILTGKFRPGQRVPDDHRAHRAYNRMEERIKKAEDLRSLAAQYEGGMTRLALHFSLTPRAISAIIPGSRTLQQLEDNVAASNVTGLPGQVREEIDKVRARWSAG